MNEDQHPLFGTDRPVDLSGLDGAIDPRALLARQVQLRVDELLPHLPEDGDADRERFLDLLHAPDLDKAIRTKRDSQIERLLWKVRNAVTQSSTAGMVNLGRVRSHDLSDLFSVSLRITPSGKAIVKAPDQDEIPLDLATTADARPARAGDLVTGGLPMWSRTAPPCA